MLSIRARAKIRLGQYDEANKTIRKMEQRGNRSVLFLRGAGSASERTAAVSSLAKNAGDFPIPVAIVPGHLSDEELDALS